MSEIKCYTLEYILTQPKVLDEAQPSIIVGPPSEELLRLEKEGYLVLCELQELQGLSESEVEKRLREDSSLWKYQNICIDAKALPEAYFQRLWYRYNGLPVQIAETDRLIIRESIVEDAAAFQELYADKEVQEFLEMPPIEQLMKEACLADELLAYEKYINQYAENQYNFYEYGMWSVIEKEGGNVIGRMGLELQQISDGEEGVSLGYALLSQYRDKGYAYEACLAILDYCHECGYATEIFVKIDDKNTKSKKLFQKIQKYSRIPLRKTKAKG